MTTTLKLARLLAVLRSGETLAAQIAWRQSQLVHLPWMARALRVQAAQEHGHAAMATAALALAGSATRTPDVALALRQQLNHDLDQGNLAASMLGLQGVVEHLGEALLESLGRYTHPAGTVLHALRVKVLAQEHSHVLLGARCLQALEKHSGNSEALDRYRAIGQSAAKQVATLLDDARLDAGVFWAKVDARLTDWHQRAYELQY